MVLDSVGDSDEVGKGDGASKGDSDGVFEGDVLVLWLGWTVGRKVGFSVTTRTMLG